MCALLPPPSPPIPLLKLDSFQLLLEQANQALGRLDGLASLLPYLPLFLYAYVRKEAVLSSQIDGTRPSSLISCSSKTRKPLVFQPRTFRKS